MPLIHSSTYTPPWFLRNAHVQSIAPNLLRRVAGVTYQRTRIETPDDDFLDVDYSSVGTRRVADTPTIKIDSDPTAAMKAYLAAAHRVA